MKQLNLYKIVGKDNKEVLCLSVKNLLAHLRELDVLAVRDDKVVLGTLLGELAEAVGELVLPEPIVAGKPQRDREAVIDSKSLPVQKRSNVGNPEVDEEDIPRPVQKKRPVHDIRATDEEAEGEGDDEAEVEEEGNEEEEFKLR